MTVWGSAHSGALRGAVAAARARIRALRASRWAGPMVRAADRFWWARLIQQADIVDLTVVHEQRAGMSERRAIRHYVRRGFRDGFVLNPLFSEQLVSMQLSDAGRVPALYAYLVNERQRIETSLLWDAREYAVLHPESRDDAAGPLGHAWRSLASGGSILFGIENARVKATRSDVDEMVVEALSRARSAAPMPAEITRDALLWLIGDAERDIALTLRTATTAHHKLGVELILGIAGGRAESWMPAVALERAVGASVIATSVAGATADHWRRVTMKRMPIGSRLTVRGPGDEVGVDSIVRLARDRDSDATSPLVLDENGVLANAGLMRRNGSLIPLMEGHPAEDARGIGNTIPVDGIASSTLSLQVTSDAPRTASVTTDAWVIVRPDTQSILNGVVVEAGEPAPLTLDQLLVPIGLKTGRGTSFALERDHTRARVGTPRLRWALKTAAPAGLGAEWWGDTHFARGLADALRRHGQDVVIDSIGARDRPTRHLDDVEVVLRGPERIEPRTGSLKMMWVISHPDQITRDEVARFDHVFAASTGWARAAQHTLGPITPLLQCTDVHRFHPVGTPRTDRIVFVGTARGIPRPSVIEPIRAGFSVDVFGPDWTGWIPASSVVATGISNADLPALYESARLVLNDHWPAMQQSGFISNRLFDVVAAGGRAISDDVEGIDELFGGSVRTYRSVPELLELLRANPHDIFPPAEQTGEISAAVRAHHSFDARAAELLRTAARFQPEGTSI